MSRIRSIHPGLWTDEAFMGLSAFARLFYIGLWNEAYDDGVFEWKPLTLKARIFPADNVDVPALLAELMEADCIRQGDGKYGLIRNFRVYQRPKKPNSSELLKPHEHEYVGLVPNQFSTGTEDAEQREDGGGKRGEKEEEKSPPNPQGGEAGDIFDQVEQVFPRSPHYNQAKAERAWRKLSPADQRDLLSKAKSYGAWWKAQQAARGRSEAEALAYVPPLDKWISEGAWRSFEAASIPSQPSPDLVVLAQDDPLIKAIESARGKPLIFGTKGTATVTKAEVERARAIIGETDRIFDMGGERVA